jgi:predicted kinase
MPDGRSYADFCAFWRRESYGAVLGIALHNLGLGISVILSAPLTREKRDKGFFRSLKEKSSVDFFSFTIDLQPDEIVLKRNMEKRASDRDIEKMRNWDSYYAGQDRSRPLWDADRILIPDWRNGKPVIEQMLEAYPPQSILKKGRL